MSVEIGQSGSSGAIRVTLYRLREGLDDELLAPAILEEIGHLPAAERADRLARAAADAATKIPVFIERIDNHVPTGGNVLFLDGHVEFMPYPGNWPMSETTVQILNELDAPE